MSKIVLGIVTLSGLVSYSIYSTIKKDNTNKINKNILRYLTFR